MMVVDSKLLTMLWRCECVGRGWKVTLRGLWCSIRHVVVQEVEEKWIIYLLTVDLRSCCMWIQRGCVAPDNGRCKEDMHSSVTGLYTIGKTMLLTFTKN